MFSITEKQATNLVYMGATIAIDHYGLSKYMGSRLFTFVTEADHYKIVHNILEQWECYEEDGVGKRVNLSKLPDPTYVRPCNVLSSLYQENGRIDPAPMWKRIEVDPGDFNKMVYTYRVIYDLLMCMRLPFMSAEDADHFVDATVLFQMDDEFQQMNATEGRS